MIHINGKAKSRLTNVREEDIQPNATDLRLGKVFKINEDEFMIGETDCKEIKKHRGSVELEVQPDGYYHLEPGSYEVIMQNIIEVAEGEDGFVITRSTLNRNGCFLTSGLYDAGYHGVMAGVVHVNCGIMKIKPGTRIGQYLCFKAETLHKYDGDYGLNKEHDKKYKG